MSRAAADVPVVVEPATVLRSALRPIEVTANESGSVSTSHSFNFINLSRIIIH